MHPFSMVKRLLKQFEISLTSITKKRNPRFHLDILPYGSLPKRINTALAPRALVS
jgi:hypothetical protein